MGVWIETVTLRLASTALTVTPFVGVWIETLRDKIQAHLSAVTPFVGVWIETFCSLLKQNSLPSHPSWVCGLKPKF